MKQLKTFLCILFCFVFLLTAAGCGKKTVGEQGESTGTSVDNTDPNAPAYDANGYLKDSIPEGLNFDADVNILHWSDAQYMEFDEMDTSGKVSKAIVERNSAVQARLGVTLLWDSCPAGDGVYMQFTTRVENDIRSDRKYDIYAAYAPEIGILTTMGYTKNLMADDMKYLDLDKPWWPDSLVDYCMFENKLYFASGDMSTNLFYVMNGVYYNCDLMRQWNVQDDPYQMVKDGDWTLDNMLTICKSVSVSTDGGTNTDTSTYGLVTAWALTDGFFVGSGLETVVKDAEKGWSLSKNFSGQNAHTLYEKLGALWKSDYSYMGNDSKFSEIFPAGRSIFLAGQIGYAITYFGEVKFEFRVVPFPKFETNQESYQTAVGNYFSMYAVSSNCVGEDERAERLSAVLECYASEAYRQTTPALFEETFKLRYSKDAQMAEMFDIIREGVRFDLGQIHGRATGFPYNVLRGFIADGGEEFSSTIARTAYSINQQIADLVEGYRKLQ